MPDLSEPQRRALRIASNGTDGQGNFVPYSFPRHHAAPRTLQSLVRLGYLERTTYYRLTTYRLTQAGAEVCKQIGLI